MGIRQKLSQLFGRNQETKTATYKSSALNPYYWLFSRDVMPFSLSMVELMLLDHQVHFGLTIRNAPLQSAQVEVSGEEDEVCEFVGTTWKKIWETSFHKIVKAKNYGWGGFEVLYKERDGRWEFAELNDFHPRDTVPLLRDGQRVG